jgi:hypothetical protein
MIIMKNEIARHVVDEKMKAGLEVLLVFIDYSTLCCACAYMQRQL